MRKQTALFAAAVAGLVIVAASVQTLLSDTPERLPDRARARSEVAVTTPAAETLPAPSHAPPIDAVPELLRKEIEAREQLTKTVARLEKEVKELKGLFEDRTPAKPQKNAAPAAIESTDSTRADAKSPEDERAQRAGLDPATVAQIRQRYEQIEMDRLYLKDRAQREGWSGTARYSNEVAKIEERRADIRNSLGESGYDAYLYASGDPNRVAVRELISGSPAGTAGLQPGDTVLRYDGKRVFTVRELQNATAAGRAGESVAVDVERDGQPMTFYVPRGPLGVYLDTDRRAP